MKVSGEKKKKKSRTFSCLLDFQLNYFYKHRSARVSILPARVSVRGARKARRLLGKWWTIIIINNHHHHFFWEGRWRGVAPAAGLPACKCSQHFLRRLCLPLTFKIWHRKGWFTHKQTKRVFIEPWSGSGVVWGRHVSKDFKATNNSCKPTEEELSLFSPKGPAQPSPSRMKANKLNIIIPELPRLCMYLCIR